jgi:hypothetical protein
MTASSGGGIVVEVLTFNCISEISLSHLLFITLFFLFLFFLSHLFQRPNSTVFPTCLRTHFFDEALLATYKAGRTMNKDALSGLERVLFNGISPSDTYSITRGFGSGNIQFRKSCFGSLCSKL